MQLGSEGGGEGGRARPPSYPALQTGGVLSEAEERSLAPMVTVSGGQA